MAFVWFLLGTITGSFTSLVVFSLVQIGKASDKKYNSNDIEHKDNIK